MSDNGHQIPPGWSVSTLGQVCQVLAGVGFPEALQGEQGHPIPVYKVGNISQAWQQGQTTLGDSPNTLTHEVAKSLSPRLVPPNTVVFAKIGAAIALNRRALTTRPCLVDNNVMGLHPSEVLDPRFLFHFSCTLQLDSLSRATTVPSIRKGDVESIRIPLPEMPEQQRIVAAIDSHFSRLDAAAATLERVHRNLERYRASVLKAAVEGRLVPTEAELAKKEGRSYEPASVLLKRILAERRRRWEEAELAKLKAKGKPPTDDRWKSRYEEPAAPDTDALPELPEGWCWARLEQIAEVKGGLAKGKHRRTGEQIHSVPYLRVANVQRGHIDLSEVKTIEATESEISDLALRSGDVLFTEGGDRDKLGRGWVWRAELPVCIHQNHVFRARLLVPQVVPEIVSWHGNSNGQRYFFDEGKHTTNLASLSLSKLRDLPVPLPPPMEQQRIKFEVERLLSLASEAAAFSRTSLQRIARLRQSILKWAFEGRLAATNPA